MSRAKTVIGLVLGLAVGAGCRWLGIPSPAPPVLTGAMLVVAMTLGYLACERWFARRDATQRPHCGGPDGSTVSTARQPPAERARR